MTRRLLRATALLLSAFIALSVWTGGARAAAPRIQVTIDGRPVSFDVPPRLESGRTLVPLRAIAEALNLTVDWDGATETITLTGGGISIILVVGDSNAWAGGKTVRLDVPARVVDGRTLVPARFIGEALGADVTWDAATSTVVIRSAGDWAPYTNPGGLSLEHPRGWTAKTDAAGWVQVAGPNGESLTVWPFFTQGKMNLFLAEKAIQQLGRKVFPDVTWGFALAQETNYIYTKGKGPGKVANALMTWVVSPSGVAGYAYFAAASSADQYRAAAETFARISKSVKVAGAPEAAGHASQPAGLSYAKWEDPEEKAFTLEIPKGWTAEGGAVRPSLVLVQMDAAVTSPDGQIRLWMGDHYNLFTEPNWVLSFAGLGPGSAYVDGGGYRWRIEPYAAGADFAVKYFLPDRLGQFEVVRKKALPELAANLVSVGINQFDAGEVEYRFTRNGERYVGGATVVTERISTGDGNVVWHLWRAYLWEAPEARRSEAETALAHLAQTFAINDDWAQMQAKLTAAQSQIITDMGHQISDTINSAYQYRQATGDLIDERRSDAILGLTEVTDGLTGEKLKVENSANYYWINNEGKVVGTETSTTPDFDFRPLVQAP